jgi:hypothetical protein
LIKKFATTEIKNVAEPAPYVKVVEFGKIMVEKSNIVSSKTNPYISITRGV